MDGFAVVAEVPVRYSDEDNLGLVNNARYFTYLEEARVEYLRQLGLTEPLPDWTGAVFVIAEAYLAYLAPAHYGWTLRVGVRCEWVRRSSFRFAYRIENAAGRAALAEGWTRQVMVERGSGKPTPVPDDLRRRMEALEGRPLSARDRPAGGQQGGGHGE